MAAKLKTKLVKNNGQIFTPDYLVKDILNFAGYSGDAVLHKHVIDNSCGTGAFLVQVVGRYCEAALSCGLGHKELRYDLEKYVHGIELDGEAHKETLKNLAATAKHFGLAEVDWDIRHADTLTVSDYDGKMDFVVGNPPYVRVHNLNDSYNKVKTFTFADSGMTDLYLVFYELGLRMLKSEGRLCYITPSSWLASLAGQSLRNYIKSKGNLLALIDLEHFQPFEATAYTMIALFQNGVKNTDFGYYKYNNTTYSPEFVSRLSFSEIDILGNFYLANSELLARLRTIKTNPVPKRVCVKNGFATLADKIFIGNVPETEITIPIIKASTGKWSRGLFPYRQDGTPIPEQQLFKNHTIRDYFQRHKDELTKGRSEMSGWFYYGRTQALRDVCKNKYAINSIIKDVDSIKLNPVPSGCGVYSGLYILSDISEEVLKSIVVSKDFVNYVSSLKSYKSGGYYTFNSKDLEQYVNYKLNEMYYEEPNNIISNDKPGVFESDLKLF